MSILHWIITGVLIGIPVAIIVMLTLAVSSWVRRRKGGR
jgi:hypothetical protein